MPDVVVHGQTHRPEWVGGSDPATPVGYYEIKVYPDAGHPLAILDPTIAVVVTGDGQFVFAIPEDLDGGRLIKAHAYVSTAGAVTVQVRNVTAAVDMLSTKVTVDTGDFTSYDAATPPVVNNSNAVVDTGDLVAVDIDAADGTAEGLGVILVFATV